MYVKRKFTWCVGAVPVELTLGECVKLLGDLDSHIDTTENADLGILLDNIRAKDDGEPVQTAHHKKNRFSSNACIHEIGHPKKFYLPPEAGREFN